MDIFVQSTIFIFSQNRSYILWYIISLICHLKLRQNIILANSQKILIRVLWAKIYKSTMVDNLADLISQNGTVPGSFYVFSFKF